MPIGTEEVVLLRHVPAHARVEARPVGLHLALRVPVEREDGLDLVGPVAREQPGEHPAHAEADHAEAVAADRLVVRKEVDRAAHVARGAVGRQLGHQPGGLVHLGVLGQLAVVEVRYQRDEARGTEPIGLRLDAGVEAPPLLHDDDAGAGAVRGTYEVPARGAAVAREFDGLSHVREPTPHR